MLVSRHLRPNRAFRPILPVRTENGSLEPRVSAASLYPNALLDPADYYDLSLAQPPTSPTNPPLESALLPTPAFTLLIEPGIVAFSVDPLDPNPPPPSTITSPGTEDAVDNISGGTLPSGFVGTIDSYSDTTNTLETNGFGSPGTTIAIDVNLSQQISQTTPIVGPFPLALAFGSSAESGVATGAPPAAITWGFVDSSLPSAPPWGTVPGNLPPEISGFFTVSFTPYAGDFGANPPDGGLMAGPPGPPPALAGTGIWFNSAATGVFIQGPVVDPSTGNVTALQYSYPTISGGVVIDHALQYYDNFFGVTSVPEHTLSMSYQTITGAAGEAIAYTAQLNTAYMPSPVATGGGSTYMSLQFQESISTQ